MARYFTEFTPNGGTYPDLVLDDEGNILEDRQGSFGKAAIRARDMIAALPPDLLTWSYKVDGAYITVNFHTRQVTTSLAEAYPVN